MTSGDAGRVAVEILSVGDEILAGSTTNTNAGWMARALAPYGFEVRRVTEVGDVEADIQAAVRDAMQQVKVLLVTGGLGPTPDDHTKEDIAQLFDDPLEPDAGSLEAMRQRFAARGLTMPTVNEKQALIPRSARVIANPIGSAPGVHWHRDDCQIFLMPGVPSEMQAMLRDHVIPHLVDVFPQAVPLHMDVFRTTGIGESTLLERIDDLRQASHPLHWAFYPSWHGVDVKVSGEAGEAQVAAWQAVRDGLRQRLHEYLYSEDAEQSLAAACGQALVERGATVATAESCTGGLAGKHLTDESGSSAWYVGGFVTYSNDLKQRLLGVPEQLLVEHGAVSAPVAAAMAHGARQATGATYAVSLTGVAGPTGGTDDKPVGLVYIGVATESEARVQRFQFGKRRAFNREIASQRAIDQVRRHLLGLPCGSVVRS